MLPQCALQVRDNVKFQVSKNGVWCRIFFVCAFFLAFGHITSSSVRHFPMLLHLNNHEVHKFIILLREPSFWYFLLYALRTHSHYWLHFPPTYFLLMECVDCVSPLLSKLLLFRWFSSRHLWHYCLCFSRYRCFSHPISEIWGLILSKSWRRYKNYPQMHYLCFYRRWAVLQTSLIPASCCISIWGGSHFNHTVSLKGSHKNYKMAIFLIPLVALAFLFLINCPHVLY